MDDYENFELNNRIDAAIFEAEEEVEKGAKPISAKKARQKLDSKYYGKV
jgi:hypothetical protein